MEPAPSLAAELWRPPPPHLADAAGASSVVTSADRSNGARSRAGSSSSSRRRPRPGRCDSAASPLDEPSKLVSTSGAAAAAAESSADPEAKRLELLKSSDNNDKLKAETETDSGSASKAVDKKPAPPEPPKQDYIHVKARRGQATDSHSLAERARREKISERMKVLQDLVPGCNKVIGKASVLDEIINYIQSLQRQVEFLSMKLEAVNAHSNGIVAFPSKDFGAPAYKATPSLTFDPQTPREYAQGPTSDWLHMQIGNAYERVT